MRGPRAPGTPIDARRRGAWHSRFLHYRYPPSNDEIAEFLAQFDQKQDLGARLLDSVEIVTREQIENAFRSLMNGLPGWHRLKRYRAGEWRFVPYSFASGESGDEMIHSFRQAMGMTQRHYDELFIHPHQIPKQKLLGDDTVVLIDDFSGSGEQACKSWNRLFRELTAGVGTIYLMVVAATGDAQAEIRQHTDLQVRCHFHLGASDNFFSNACRHFSTQDKDDVLECCTAHFPDEPRGHGDCGLLFVFYHDCPNNSIPILHKQTSPNWTPLFPRTRNR